MLKDKQYGDFQRWLDDATEGLPPFERERVRWELESHLVEVIKQQLETIPEDVTSHKAFFDALLGSTQGTSEGTNKYLTSLINERRKIDHEVRITLKFAKSVHLRALVRWIETATRGLCDEALQRISAEIQAHALDAVQDGMARGQSDSEAFKAVMAGLGNPEKAGKAFRRVYLTQHDKLTLTRLRFKAKFKDERTKYVLWTLLLLLYASLVWTFSEISVSERLAGIVLVMGIVLFFPARSWLTRRLIERGRMRTAVVFHLFSFVLFILYLCRNDIAELAVFLCIYLLIKRHCFRLFVKLGKKQPVSPPNPGEY